MYSQINIYFYSILYFQLEQQEEAEANGEDAGQEEGGARPLGPVSVEIEDAEPHAFQLVLAYIYTDRIHPHSNPHSSAYSNTAGQRLDGNEVTSLMMDVYRLALKVN